MLRFHHQDVNYALTEPLCWRVPPRNFHFWSLHENADSSTIPKSVIEFNLSRYSNLCLRLFTGCISSVKRSIETFHQISKLNGWENKQLYLSYRSPRCPKFFKLLFYYWFVSMLTRLYRKNLRVVFRQGEALPEVIEVIEKNFDLFPCIRNLTARQFQIVLLFNSYVLTTKSFLSANTMSVENFLFFSGASIDDESKIWSSHQKADRPTILNCDIKFFSFSFRFWNF